MAERIDDEAADWPLRPWIMATICAVAGLLFHQLTDYTYGQPLSADLRTAFREAYAATLPEPWKGRG